MSTLTGDLAKVFNAINKKMGDDTIVLGSEITQMGGRLTTGSVAIDVALGGGWPSNQWHELIGEASNGKTALALKTIAANQKNDPEFTTVWVAAEEWVPGYAEMCGVDVSRVYVVSTNIMEEAYEAVIKIVESKAVDCIVLDSLPALVPGAEDQKEMEEARKQAKEEEKKEAMKREMAEKEEKKAAAAADAGWRWLSGRPPSPSASSRRRAYSGSATVWAPRTRAHGTSGSLLQTLLTNGSTSSTSSSVGLAASFESPASTRIN